MYFIYIYMCVYTYVYLDGTASEYRTLGCTSVS